MKHAVYILSTISVTNAREEINYVSKLAANFTEVEQQDKRNVLF